MTDSRPQENYTPHPRPARFDERIVPDGQLDAKLGIELIDFNPQRVVARMPVAGNLQPYGLLHGGASAAIMETVGSTAAALNAPEGMICVGTQVLTNHHRATRTGTVTAVATPVHVGRSLSTFKIELTNDNGELVASGHLSAMTLPAPPGEKRA